MKRSFKTVAVFAALGAASAVAPSASAAVLITEVLYNEVGSDTAGEWVEIHNPGSTPVDLSGYKVGDEETAGGDSESGGMWQFPEGAALAPGQTVVVTNSAARFFAVYGFNPSFETAPTDDTVPDMRGYLAWVNPPEPNAMANGNDQAVLLGPDDTVADVVSWGNTFAFDPALADAELDGQSYERINLTDTNTAADWRLGNPSSPFAPPEAVPEPGVMGVLGIAGVVLLRRRRD